MILPINHIMLVGKVYIYKKKESILIISLRLNNRVSLEEPIEISENKMLRRIREFNDLMTWMDSEFWEQCDEYVYSVKK